MTLQKAIEILNDHLLYWKDQEPPDFHNALRLGEEALKHLQQCRDWCCAFAEVPLPGETKE